MNAIALRTSTGLDLTVRLLADGDTATVRALFDRLGPESRSLRFGGAKTTLSQPELDALARVDADHHVLVAHATGDDRPAGIVRLVRDPHARLVADFAISV